MIPYLTNRVSQNRHFQCPRMFFIFSIEDPGKEGPCITWVGVGQIPIARSVISSTMEKPLQNNRQLLQYQNNLF